MMLKKSSLILLLLLAVVPTRLWAQPGLVVFWPQQSGADIILSSYTGLDLEPVDTLHGNAEGRFFYEPILPTGMYVVDSEETTLEFLSVGKPLMMNVEANTVRFEGSPENTLWTAYLQVREKYHYGYKEPEKYQSIVDSLAGSSTDYAARLMRIDANPVLKASDFEELDAIPTNVLTTKMVAYLEQSADDFVKGVDHILELAKLNIESYAFALQYLLKGFTALGLSEVTEHLLNFPQLAEGEITQEEGTWLESLVEPYQKVRVGAKAPDIEGVTIDGKPYRLYDSQAQRILVVFWSVDCEYCHDFLKQIRKRLDLKHDYELVTIALAENQKEVECEVRKLKIPGYHFFDEARWEGKAFLDYHVSSTPTAFLLDRDKMILAKPKEVEEVKGER